MILLPIALFWFLVIWGAASRRPVLVYLFFAVMPFGSFAVLPTSVTGGLTFTGLPIVAFALVLRAFARRDGVDAALGLALRPSRLLLLFLFGCVAIITTLFMPRLFEGSIQVVPIRGDLATTVPLRPTAQNLSQLLYLLLAVASVFAFARILQTQWQRQQAFQAMCLGGAVVVVTGFLDFASSYVPLQGFLSLFRTASYALISDVEVYGSKRVVGLMPEASAYGGLCLGYLCALYFYRRVIVSSALRDRLVPVVLALLLVCIWLAKSTGAYVGVALFFVLAGLEWAIRLYARERDFRRGLGGELVIVVLALIGLSTVVIAWPQVLDPVYQLIDRMVLQKSESDSYAQRGMWRAIAYDAFLQSHGLGLGLGSARTSSSLVAILTGTGLLGALLYYGFVAQTLLRGLFVRSREMFLILSAFRFAFLPGFLVGAMVGGADFGGLEAFGYGLVCAVGAATRRPMEVLNTTGGRRMRRDLVTAP